MIDFTQFTTDLSAHGTVKFCGYNGDDTTKIIIKMEGIVPIVATLAGLNTIIHNYTGVTHPYNNEILITSGQMTVMLSETN